MRFSLRSTLPLFAFLCLLLLTGRVQAQLQVELTLHRNLYIRYEPLIVTVNIMNLSGRPLLLSDQGDVPWFGFQIESKDGRPVRPRIVGYGKDPVAIGAGETLRRQVNLTPLFSLDEFGRYTIRAAVYEASQSRYYNSPPVIFEITEGRVLWQENVGHPEDSTARRITLLAHRLTESTALYIRITNPEDARVFCTHRLGGLVSYGKPEVELDRNNEAHILQMRAPRNFIYSHIGLNGEIRERKAYEQTSSKPTLRRDANGQVQVVGGSLVDPSIKAAEALLPNASDRPVPLPGQGGPAPVVTPSPTPKPKGGLNLWPFKKKST